VSDLSGRVERLEEAADGLVNMGEQIAWDRIEKAADRLVEKSGDVLSHEAAVARYLRTDAGKRDYARYRDASADRLRSVQTAGQAIAHRHLAEQAAHQLVGLIEKCQDAGLTPVEVYEWLSSARPDLLAAVGVDVPEPVAKADGAMAAIEDAAQRLMARNPTMPHHKAISMALARSPALYTAYCREAGLPVGDAAPPDQAEAEEPELPEPDPGAATAAQRGLVRAFTSAHDRASSEHGVPPPHPVRKAAAREPVALEGGYIFVDLDDE
jgi:hypothetical protein